MQKHPAPWFVAISVRHEAGCGQWRAEARKADAFTGEPLDDRVIVAYADGPTAAAREAGRRLADA